MIKALKLGIEGAKLWSQGDHSSPRTTTLTSDTNFKCKGFPEPLSGSLECHTEVL